MRLGAGRYEQASSTSQAATDEMFPALSELEWRELYHETPVSPSEISDFLSVHVDSVGLHCRTQAGRGRPLADPSENAMALSA